MACSKQSYLNFENLGEIERKSSNHTKNERPHTPSYNSERNKTVQKNLDYPFNQDPLYSFKCPKEDYQFNNKLLQRCNSSNKVIGKDHSNSYLDSNHKTLPVNIKSYGSSNKTNLTQLDSRDHSYISNNGSKISNISAASQYLDRRHQETQAKISQMKVEKYNNEIGKYNFKPKISENSQKIVNKLMKDDVVEKRFKENFLQKEEDCNNMNTHTSTQANQRKSNLVGTIVRTRPYSSNKIKQNSNKVRTIDNTDDYRRMIERREMRIKEEKEKSAEGYGKIYKVDTNYTNDVRRRPSSSNPKQRNRVGTTSNPINKMLNMQKLGSCTPDHSRKASKTDLNTDLNADYRAESKLDNSYLSSGKQLNTINNHSSKYCSIPQTKSNTLRHPSQKYNDDTYLKYNKEEVIDARFRLNSYLTKGRNEAHQKGVRIVEENKYFNDNRNILEKINKIIPETSNLLINQENYKSHNIINEDSNKRNDYNKISSKARQNYAQSKPVKVYNLQDNSNSHKTNKTPEEKDRGLIYLKSATNSSLYNYNNLDRPNSQVRNSLMNVDFNQLDVFSPPYNKNMIDYNVQKMYSNVENIDNKINNRSKTPETIENPDRRKKEINNLVSYIEKLKTNSYNNEPQYQSYLINKNIENAVKSNIEISTKTKNEEKVKSDNYKLDPSSKSFALQKLQQIKAEMREYN
jgi:hypothetical protein